MAPTNTPAAGNLDLEQDVKILLTIKKGPKEGNPRNKDGLVVPIKLSQGFEVFKTTIMAFKEQPQFRSSILISKRDGIFHNYVHPALAPAVLGANMSTDQRGVWQQVLESVFQQ